MRGPDRKPEQDEVVLRIPRIGRPDRFAAGALVLATTVALLCDRSGLANMAGDPLDEDSIGPLIGFLVLLVVWIGTVALFFRAARRRPTD